MNEKQKKDKILINFVDWLINWIEYNEKIELKINSKEELRNFLIAEYRVLNE